MVEDNDEPQMLTDRQKEVRERQQHEAALFPEIRSSPRAAPNVADYRLPTLAFKSNETSGKPPQDETTSPSFPPDVMMHDYLGSSPTPSSSRKISTAPYSDDGPPSSPPLIPSDLRTQPTPGLPQHDGEVGREKELSEDQERLMGEPVTMLPTLHAEGDNPELASAGVVHDSPFISAHPDDTGANIFSDMDTYVDAPTERANLTSTDFCTDANTVSNVLRRPEASHASAENDEVTAQLMGEIARASSQRSSPHTQEMQENGKANKRRLTRPANGPRKRRKVDKESSSGQVIADCVLVDARLTTKDLDKKSPFPVIEQVASSPHIELATQVHDFSPSLGERSGESRQASRESDQADGAPPSSKRRIRVKAEPGVHRRSGRITRTSSRLSDAGTDSPHRSDAPVSSQDPAESSEVPWVSGPRGSRWAYVPTTVPAVASQRASATGTNHHGQAASSQPAAVGPIEPPRPEDERSKEEQTAAAVDDASDMPTASGLLDGLRTMLQRIRRVTLRPEEERAMIGVLFDSVQQVHEAGRRHPARDSTF